MKFIAIAAALAVATPAVAADNSAFTGVRAEVTAGLNDITKSPDRDDVTYGAAIGVDFPVGDKFTLGVEGNTSNIFDDDRQIGAAARVGYAFNGRVLGFVQGGYNNYRDVFSRELDGLTAGAGVQVALTNNAYVKAQYNYSDFERNVGSHAGLVGVGFRF